MTSRFCTAAVAAYITLLAAPASAVTLDIATIKCSDLDGTDAEQVGIILAWIDGYLGGRADDTRFDIDRFSANADAAAEACKTDVSAGLLSVLKDAEAESGAEGTENTQSE